MDINNIVNLIENMTLLELNELVKFFENKYDINLNNFNFNKDNSNQIDEIKKKVNYSLNLINIGNNKISVIRIVREIVNLGLKETKDLIESCPVLIKDNLEKDVADNIAKKLETAGAKVEIK